MTKNQARKEILDLWSRDVGQRETNGKNRSPLIDSINTRIGGVKTLGAPYCIAGLLARGVIPFCERHGFKMNRVHLTHGTQEFFRVMSKNGYARTTGDVADIGIMQNRTDENYGHAWGVVKKLNAHDYKSAEYNTDGSGSRDGDGFYFRERDDDGDFGKKFRGFIDVVQAIADANPEAFDETATEPMRPVKLERTGLLKGDKGPNVVRLQEALRKKGFSIRLDGEFGPETLKAVQAFQKSVGLMGTGAVGDQTWAALEGPPVLAWGEKRADWTAKLISLVDGSKLPDLPMKDIESFEPGYSVRTRAGKVLFWARLISKMSQYESSFNPLAQYKENFKDANGEFVISRGLLQMSIESVRGYGFKLLDETQLHDPILSLNVAVYVMEKLVEKHGRLHGHELVGGKKKWKGLAAYWSVMRETSDNFLKIKTWT
jgi:hypothetical protein